MDFLLLKGLHISCAATSYTLFLLRGIWQFRGSPVMRQRWVKIVPHIVDTLLLGSAIALAVVTHQYPFVDTWLTVKVGCLLLYIGLGFVALKYGKTITIRVLAWLAAQAVFGYIVLVAIFHNPILFLH
ncbi:MAG: SirB2 family protein [Gammaproteobacteria bacterium]|nr:SirB2 family protein [Gammaproteobacteria bacterium]MBU1482695.1 SirB2 family protein [Gammaproteobacteria bacterium]